MLPLKSDTGDESKMSIYTKRGDKGITDMVRTRNISKSDDRIRLAGTIDELNSHIGLIISMISSRETVQFLESVQGTLNLVATGVEDPYNRECRISEKRVTALETEIDNLEKLCPQPVAEKLKGNSSLAAEIDIARTVARRAERSLAQVSVKFGADTESKKFLNRLSDYFFILARYTENTGDKSDSAGLQRSEPEVQNIKTEIQKNTKTQKSEAEALNTMDTLAGTVNINEAVIREVLKRIGVQTRITLDIAKKLIDRIEQEALRRGARAVISVCNAEGNPIAVHVMDGAFLVSFDAAMKKAYTAAAVRMSTMEFGKMAQPGGTFYGADKLDNGKIVIFGGGVPLKSGDTVIGGLGISGGTGEEDHSLAEYGQSILHELI